jgi:hypothetical protein
MKTGVANSTIQDYKKRDPPFYRRNSKNPPVEPYPASVLTENIWLRQKFQDISKTAQEKVNQINNANNTIQNLIINNNKKNKEIETQKYKYEELVKQNSELFKKFQEFKLDYDLQDDENKKLKKENSQKDEDIGVLQNGFQKSKTDLAEANELLKHSNEEIKQITEERDRYKHEQELLKKEQKNNLIKDIAIGVGSFGLGIIVGSLFNKPNSYSTLSQSAERINTNIGYNLKPIPMDIPTDFSIDNWKNQYINTSGNPLTENSFNNISGSTEIGLDNITKQQNNLVQSDMQSINNEVIIETNVSGILCSGGFFNDYEKITGTGHAVFPDQHNNITQPDIQYISNRFNSETYTYDISCSGIYYSNRKKFTDVEPVSKKISHDNITPPIGPLSHHSIFPVPSDNYLPFTPINLPINPSDSYLMQQLRKTTGTQFEAYLERFFKHKGYHHVTLTQPTNDKGADLIVELGFEKIVIQAKQRKDNIGVDAISAVYASQKYYNATRAIVITTSKFTKQALELANKIGVECWDDEKLLNELNIWQFFFPPE